MNELNELITVLESGEGVDRLSRRAEREVFKSWLKKFKERLPKQETVEDSITLVMEEEE